jgi:uncharacterized protein YggL (DUF469 family)
MKKRLRKKFRTGEFTEYGFEVDFHLAAPVEAVAADALLNAFLDQLEAQSLAGGGGGGEDGAFSFFVAAGRPRLVVTDAHRAALDAWLSAQPGVLEPKVSPLTDAWHAEN